MDKKFPQAQIINVSIAIANSEIPMKKCSYCGAEYPDDATVCAVDQTSLDGSRLQNPLRASPLESEPSLRRKRICSRQSKRESLKVDGTRKPSNC
jgi:hypothetical protein